MEIRDDQGAEDDPNESVKSSGHLVHRLQKSSLPSSHVVLLSSHLLPQLLSLRLNQCSKSANPNRQLEHVSSVILSMAWSS